MKRKLKAIIIDIFQIKDFWHCDLVCQKKSVVCGLHFRRFIKKNKKCVAVGLVPS